MIVDVLDYEGKRVVFTRKKWLQKIKIHPELGRDSFLKNLKRVIIDPDEVWQDYSDPKRKRCYYKKYSAHTYIKAVVWIKSNPCNIITAYEINLIKEQNYTNLKIVYKK
ncbi:MAG: PBECR2 nuclease fold domain-containing protein [Patescibacteria group bacterium]